MILHNESLDLIDVHNCRMYYDFAKYKHAIIL